MGKKETWTWIGDDGNNKAVCISKKIYSKGDEIPAEEVSEERRNKWLDNGLASDGDRNKVTVTKDSKAVKHLETEIKSLKAALDCVPGKDREIAELNRALEKVQKGAKAGKLKGLEAENADLKENAIRQTEHIKNIEDGSQESRTRIEELELDNQEKVALIEKLNKGLEEATAPGGGK